MRLIDKVKVLLLGYQATSESYISKLRSLGVEIGEDVILYRPYNTTIDIQNPHLLSIGSHVMITGPVTILTHDYGWSVLKRNYGKILGNQRVTKIGSNVFVGWGSTILGGAQIGDNTIIGANSVVSGTLEGNAVYAGNPARKIMSLDDYFQKRESKQAQEVVEYILCYEKRFGKWPEEKDLDEYFFTFTKGTDEALISTFDHRLRLMMNYDESLECLKQNTPQFESFDALIAYCVEEKELRKTER